MRPQAAPVLCMGHMRWLLPCGHRGGRRTPTSQKTNWKMRVTNKKEKNCLSPSVLSSSIAQPLLPSTWRTHCIFVQKSDSDSVWMSGFRAARFRVRSVLYPQSARYSETGAPSMERDTPSSVSYRSSTNLRQKAAERTAGGETRGCKTDGREIKSVANTHRSHSRTAANGSLHNRKCIQARHA